MIVSSWSIDRVLSVAGQEGPLRVLDREDGPHGRIVCVIPGHLGWQATPDRLVRLLDEQDVENAGLIAAAAVAFVLRFRDRLGNPLGWRLRPLVVMQGAKSRICLSAAEALASTKLLTPIAAREVVRRADGAVLTASRGARS